MFSKFILIYLLKEAVVCVGRPQLNLLNPFNILNRMQCSLIDIFDNVDKISYNIWHMGDVNQNFPETETEVYNTVNGFMGTITDRSIIGSIINKFPLKIGPNNLIETFLGNFNRSLLMDSVKKNLPALTKQVKIYNFNKLKIAPMLKKYRSALLNAGSVATKLTLGGIACYIKKYFEEIGSYLMESLYPMRDILFSPYLKVANALGADPQCDWKDVPDVPDDMCFRSLDVLLIKGVSNLFRIKYLNFFSSNENDIVDSSVISNEKGIGLTEKDIDVTEKDIDTTEKYIDVTEKNIDVTEKDIDVTEKDIDVTEKDIDVTEKDIDVTEKDIDVTEKDIDVTEKDIDVTEKDIDVTEKDIDVTEKDINVTEKDIDVTEKDIDVTEKDIDVTEKDIDVTEKDIDVTEKDIDVTEKDIDVTEKDIDVTEKDIDVTEKDIDVTEKDIDVTEKDIDVTEKDIDVTEKDIDVTEKDIDMKEKDIDVTEKDIDVTEKDIDVTEKDIDVTEKDIDVTEKDIDVTEKDIDVTEKDIDVTEKDIDVTEKDIDVTEKDIDTTEKDIDITEKDINLRENSVDETDNPIFFMESTKRHDPRSLRVQRKSSIIWSKKHKHETDKIGNPREWGHHQF